jgi:hypothetical protein
MARAVTSAVAIVLASAIGSGAIACNPEGLEKNFTSQKDEEARWQEFVIDEQCEALGATPGDSATIEKLKAHFMKGHEGNGIAQGAIDGCSAEQIVEAAC